MRRGEWILWRGLESLTLAILFLFGGMAGISRANYLWTGGGGPESSFENPNNWQGHTSPPSSTESALIEFSGVAAAYAPAVTIDRSVSGILFGSNASGWNLISYPYYTLSIGSSGVLSLGQTGTTNSVNANLRFTVDNTLIRATQGTTLNVGGFLLAAPDVTHYTVGTTNHTGTVVLTGTASIQPNLQVNVAGGTLVLSKSGNYAITGNATVGAGATLRLAAENQIRGDAIVTINGTQSSHGVLDMNGRSVIVGGLSSAAGQNHGVIINNAVGTTSTLGLTVTGITTYTGTIGDGVGRVCVSTLPWTTGTQVLANANTYTGTTSVLTKNGIQLGHTLAAQYSTVDLQRSLAFSEGIKTFTIGGLSGFTFDQSLTDVLGEEITLQVGNNNQNTTFSGNLTGGSMIKIGSGTLVISGPTIDLRTTVVESGTLHIQSSGHSNGDLVVNNGTLSSSAYYQNATINNGAATFIAHTVIVNKGTVSAQFQTGTLNGGTLISPHTYGGSVTQTLEVNGGTFGGSVQLLTLNAGGRISPGFKGTGQTSFIHGATDSKFLWNSDDLTAGIEFDLTTLGNGSDLLWVHTLEKGTGALFLWDFSGGVVGETYSLVLMEIPLDTGNMPFYTNFDAEDFGIATEGYAGTFFFQGNTLKFTLEAVPEPGTVSLLLLAAGGLGSLYALRRRRVA